MVGRDRCNHNVAAVDIFGLERKGARPAPFKLSPEFTTDI